MTKHLGTLNVDAGDAGPISLEITTSTSLERIAAVLRFADEMTTDALSPAAIAALVPPTVDAPDPPPCPQRRRPPAPRR